MTNDMTNSRIYHRYFNRLRGVDLSAEPSEVSLSHLTLLENMWCDPTQDGGCLESYPGYRVFARFGEAILGIFRHRVNGEDFLVVHAGEKLYRFPEQLRNYESTLSEISPYDITVPSVRGCAFAHEDGLCLLIGGRYLFIDKDGALKDVEETLAYLPTTYFDGKAYEQRNLLTNEVCLAFTADGPYEAFVEEEGLLFSPISEEAKTCMVRISEKHRRAGKIKIPKTVLIGTETYTVSALAPYAFANMPSLISVEIPETVTAIGTHAFYADSGLRILSLPQRLTGIGPYAFYGCLSLEKLFLGGSALHIIRENAFHYCPSLAEVRYAGTEEEYLAISMEGDGTLRDLAVSVSYQSSQKFENFATVLRYPLSEPCLSVTSVKLGEDVLEENFLPIGEGFVRYQPISEGEYVTHIELSVSDKDFLLGKTLRAISTVPETKFSLPEGKAPFQTDGRHAFLGMSAVGKFDGRVFFTGNPSFPNTVFYSAIDDTGKNNPFYIGCLNYFNDGTGSVANRGFLVSGGLLAVLKADAGGEGEIFFHAPQSTEEDLIPRIYPAVAFCPGVGLAGCAINFADDAVFLGKHGLFDIAKGSTDTERSLLPRSSAVNARLLRENIAGAQMAVFEGYLYLLTEGNVYLADQRRRSSEKSSGEYEWYFLRGVGSYAGDHPVYRYTALLPEGSESLGLSTHSDVGGVAEGTLYSATLPSGLYVYYVENQDGRFPVDTDGERAGGMFFPADTLCATDTALYFGTAEGALGCFNTDKRGQAMYRALQTDLYILKDNGEAVSLSHPLCALISEDTVQRKMLYERVGEHYLPKEEATVFLDNDRAALLVPTEDTQERGKVHRYYYTFANHPFRALCALAMDDGGLPHYAKDTVPRSATLKVKTPEGSDFCAYVRTDRHPFRLSDRLIATNADAGDTDFAAFDFHSDTVANLTLRERERGWCYKQYLFACEGFRSPFGIFSLTYSFRPSGRIKP